MPRNPLPAKNAASKAYNHFNLASFTIGVEGSNTINVAVQLKDARGQNLGSRAWVDVFLAADSGGAAITGTAPTSTLAIGTNGAIQAVQVTDKAVRILTNATGGFDLDVIQTAAPVTYYLAVLMPDGSLSVSGAITFA